MTGGRRLAPLAADQWGEAEYAAFGTLLGIPGDRVPRAGSGEKYDPLRFDVVGTMVRHPSLAEAFWVYNGRQLHHNTLPVRWRELVVLRIAHARQSAYEWGQHVKMALDAGIGEAEIGRLVAGNLGFEGTELVLLLATDELLRDGRLSDEVWGQVTEVLDEHQAMDLLFLVGTYTMLAMVFETWRLPPEPGFAPLPPLPGGPGRK